MENEAETRLSVRIGKNFKDYLEAGARDMEMSLSEYIRLQLILQTEYCPDESIEESEDERSHR